jgi:glycerol-3-phosphate dehydrogenase
MQRTFEGLAAAEYDLLIVGGGITGAGVALDAALRGLRVALIDQGDFASGTSSASSKLVHGGLRYLEQGHLRLVREALVERRRLLRNAPHLVRPLRFVLPFYKGGRLPAWKAMAGLYLYDLLAGANNLRHSRRRTAASLRREFPGLRPANLTGAAEYFDAQMDDARLCLEVVRTAWVHGTHVANYAEAVAIERTGDRFVVTVRDRSPLGPGSGPTVTVRARQVLNAAGPWVDRVRALAGEKGGPLVEPTKGVHLVLDVPGGPPPAAFLLLHPADGRVFFVIPWHGRVLLGTTDTFTDEPPDRLTVAAADEAYLLEGYNHHFDPALTADAVCGRFAGLRPLLRAEGGGPSARSREWRLVEGSSGVLSAAGGKYTTYRSMAEAITDRVAARLGVSRPCRTARHQLDGAPDFAWESFVASEPLALARDGLDLALARHLVNRYGRRARDVAAVIRREPGGTRLVFAGEPDVRGEWAYQREAELALCPADHLLRRTRLGLCHPELLREPRPIT